MLLVNNLILPNGKEINFEIKAGQHYFIKGQNGSGKTLLLRSLAALYPLNYSRFEYKHTHLTDWNICEFRSRVLYVPAFTSFNNADEIDEYFSLTKKLSVYKNFIPNLNYNEYLVKWNLTGKKLKNLSSGQKQLISILRALSLKAEILLLDEPTSHLDQQKTLEVEKLILEWAKTEGRSIVFVGHDEAQEKRLGFKIFEL